MHSSIKWKSSKANVTPIPSAFISVVLDIESSKRATGRHSEASLSAALPLSTRRNMNWSAAVGSRSSRDCISAMSLSSSSSPFSYSSSSTGFSRAFEYFWFWSPLELEVFSLTFNLLDFLRLNLNQEETDDEAFSAFPPPLSLIPAEPVDVFLSVVPSAFEVHPKDAISFFPFCISLSSLFASLTISYAANCLKTSKACIGIDSSIRLNSTSSVALNAADDDVPPVPAAVAASRACRAFFTKVIYLLFTFMQRLIVSICRVEEGIQVRRVE